jgi:hypothetical protein
MKILVGEEILPCSIAKALGEKCLVVPSEVKPDNQYIWQKIPTMADFDFEASKHKKAKIERARAKRRKKRAKRKRARA